MKKSFLRVAAVFVTIITVAGILYGCGGTKEPNEGIDTVTDKDGITYLAIVDEKDGHIMAGVTNENGELFAAEIDENGNVLKDGILYPVDYKGELPTNDTTVVAINESQNTDYNYANKDVEDVQDKSETESIKSDTTGTQNDKTTEKNNNTTTTKKHTTDNNSQIPASESLAEKYKKLFLSQTYYIEFSTDDESTPEPVALAVKNGNIYMKTKFEGMNCTMLYLKKKDSVYIVISDYRVYCKMPSSMMDDINMDFSDVADVSSSESYDVYLGERECRCEEYKLVDGSTSTYYFYNNELVRLDQTSKDGETSIMNISKVSSSVDDSLFELPKGYIPVNLSKFDFGEETTTEK